MKTKTHREAALKLITKKRIFAATITHLRRALTITNLLTNSRATYHYGILTERFLAWQIYFPVIIWLFDMEWLDYRVCLVSACSTIALEAIHSIHYLGETVAPTI